MADRTEHFMMGYHAANDTELVQEIYRRYDENVRLTKTRAAQVEFLTNIHYIEKYLYPGAKILDIGAGTGEYSFYLARKGYNVCSLELADRNIEIFRSRMLAEDKDIDLQQGNALDLNRYENEEFDVVLLFGPLYHLHSEADQMRCIAEAKRVCKKEGKIFFAFISNDIVILTMQKEHPEYLTDGAYDKKTFQLDDFPFVFHTVERCRELLKKSKVDICHAVASDGVSELISEMINAMDEQAFDQYLKYHFYLCEKAECIGMSNHLLFVGR